MTGMVIATTTPVTGEPPCLGFRYESIHEAVLAECDGVYVDEAGAITIPHRFWNTLGIAPDEPLWVISDTKNIMIAKCREPYLQSPQSWVYEIEPCTMDESGKVALPESFLQTHNIDLCTRFCKVLIYKDKVLCYLSELPGDGFITHQGNIPIDDVGAVTIPVEYLKEVGLAPNQSIWIVSEEGDLVITKDLYGYGSCERERVVVGEDGKLEIPAAFLGRLKISASEEVHATLMTGKEGSSIWIKARLNITKSLTEYDKAFSRYIQGDHYARAEAALLNDTHDTQAEARLMNELQTAFNVAWKCAGGELPEWCQSTL